MLGLAVDLIEFDSKYENILLHLLGKVWVIADLPSAVAIGKKRGFSHRMVTLDGELVTPGGALTGGNHEKERSSLLARQRQILELEQSIQQLAEQMEQQNQELDAYYIVTGEKKAAITELHSQDQELIRRTAQLEQQLNQQQREEQRLQKEISFEQFSLQEQRQQLQEQQTALEQEKAERTTLAETEKQLQAQAEAIREKLQQQQEQQKTLQNTCNQNGIQLATAQQRWELLAQQSNT